MANNFKPITRNGFTFRGWVNPNPRTRIFNFIKGTKYKIDRFETSSYCYLWYDDKNQYYEIDTDLDIREEKNIDLLIETFDELLREGMLTNS